MGNKKIKINEEQLKEIIYNDIFRVSYSNPLSLMMYGKIDEGYYASYPIEKIKKYIY